LKINLINFLQITSNKLYNCIHNWYIHKIDIYIENDIFNMEMLSEVLIMQRLNIPNLFLTLEESVNVRYSEDPKNASISMHSHNFIEFAYLVEGHGVEIINQDTFELRSGYFSMIFPWQTHELYFDPNYSVKYFFVAISMDNFLGAGRVALELKDLFFFSGSDSTPSTYYYEGNNAMKLELAFQEMFTEYITRKKWWELSVKSKIYDVLIMFDRQCRNNQLNQTAAKVNRNIKHQNFDIVFYIYNNFKEEINLSHLSECFGLSQNYLSTIIKASLGLTFQDFLRNLRLKYACTLLASTNMSVTDVAYASGFQSYRNFERFFRKCYTICPTQFRNMNKELYA
jgi:AraC-like DNA-binding protein/quercetin dioxygenase-like cupin family protein